MIIECENCGGKITLDDSGISPPGGDAVCPECGNTVHIDKNDTDTIPHDESNWEDFVSISKTERDADDFKLEDKHDIKRQDSDFNWANLKINEEPVDRIGGVPKMFEDEGTDDDLIITKDGGIPEADEPIPGPQLARTKGHEPSRDAPETLRVDKSILTGGGRRAAEYGGYGPAYRDHVGIYSQGSRSRGGIFARAAYTLLILIVFTVIIGASYIILSNTGVIPRETADSIERYVRSLIPVSVTGSAGKEVEITAHSGKWLDTRNGPMYVISGTVTNEAVRPVNYIQIRSEFISDGQTVYDNVVYAGNTFTESELRVSPLSDTLLKLKKKSGDIDYYNAERLSGLNSNVRPGESIPFFAVYPASVRMLGLKYNLEVVGYE